MCILYDQYHYCIYKEFNVAINNRTIKVPIKQAVRICVLNDCRLGKEDGVCFI